MASHQRRWFRKFTVRFRPIKNATMSSIYNSLVSWQATSLLDSSVVRALHRYRRGHGFESRSGLSFTLQFKKGLSLVYLRWWIMSSYLSPQFKYNFHMFTCKLKEHCLKIASWLSQWLSSGFPRLKFVASLRLPDKSASDNLEDWLTAFFCVRKKLMGCLKGCQGGVLF